MQVVILKCKPNAQFHLGKVGLDENSCLNDTSSWIHADTLFSALINIAAKIYPTDLQAIIQLFESRKLVISSAFYCLELTEQQKWVYFLPKPLSLNLASSVNNHKQLKRINFLSKGVWEKGILPDEWFDETKCVIINKQFVALKEELQGIAIEDLQLLQEQTLPKVSVHKESKENSIFYQTNLQLVAHKDLQTHFYFLVNYDEKVSQEQQQRLQTLFRILGQEGIGGERSVGCGSFAGVQLQDFELAAYTASNFCSLSLTVPKDAQEFQTFRAYQMTLRGGRPTGKKTDVTTLQRLKMVRMLAEGAVTTQATCEGSIVNISPNRENSVYLRYGMSFTVPLHQNFNLI